MKQIKLSLILMISLFIFIIGFYHTAWASSHEQEWDGRKMWNFTDGGIKYFDKDHYLKNEWMQEGEYWYYFGDDGFMLINTITPDGYYVGNEGAMLTNTTLEDGRVIGADGRIVQKENWHWILEGETWYYRDLNSGRNWTGWLYEGGYWYWLKADGTMATGLLRLNEEGKEVLYYLNNNHLDYTIWTSKEKLPYGAMLSNGSLLFMGDLAKQILQEYKDILEQEIGEDWWLYERGLTGYFIDLSFDENGRFRYKLLDLNDFVIDSPVIQIN